MDQLQQAIDHLSDRADRITSGWWRHEDMNDAHVCVHIDSVYDLRKAVRESTATIQAYRNRLERTERERDELKQSVSELATERQELWDELEDLRGELTDCWDEMERLRGANHE